MNTYLYRSTFSFMLFHCHCWCVFCCLKSDMCVYINIKHIRGDSSHNPVNRVPYTYVHEYTPNDIHSITRTHRYIQTYQHTHPDLSYELTHTQRHTNIHTNSHKHEEGAHTHPHMLSHILTHTHTHSHTHSLSLTHSHTLTLTHRHTHTHTHTDIYGRNHRYTYRVCLYSFLRN